MKLTIETFELGELIYERIGGILPTFPIIAEEGSRQPFAVYRRTALQTANTKDRYTYETTTSIEVSVTADTYPQSVSLAKEVTDKMLKTRGPWRGAVVTDVRLTGASEDFLQNVYIQRLYFEIKTDR